MKHMRQTSKIRLKHEPNEESIVRNEEQATFRYDIMNDNSPTSSAAGILYYYASVKSLGYTKKTFAKACNVSEVTIIKCYKIINNYHSFIVSHKSNIFEL